MEIMNAGCALHKEVSPRQYTDNSTMGALPEVFGDKKASGDMKTQSQPIVFAVYGVLVVLGIGTGYLLSRIVRKTPSSSSKMTVVKTKTGAGVSDAKTFRDSALGMIEKGGVDGEGTHKLIREGGVSQTAFLVSSVIDLDEYVGKKVKVFGETFAAKKAAWLMDVGKIELLQ